MKKVVIGVAILTGVLVGAVVADTAAVGEHKPPEAIEVPAQGAVEEQAAGESVPEIDLMADMDFRRWPAGHFYISFNEQIEALSATHGPERQDVLLDLAELYLGQVMLPESVSVLGSLPPEAGVPNPRWQVLNDAARLLGGQSVATSPLTLAERPDRGLWLTLNAIAENDEASLRDNIEDGFAGLAYQSRPVARTLLPIFTEVAIELGDQPLSSLGLDLIREVPDLDGSPAGYYLRGRDAENQGNSKSAVEAYFESAKGWDRYAARGRVALSDMALRDGSRGALLAARDVLESGSEAWRGDGYEMQVLQRLADVYSELGDSVGALLTYGKLMLRFPGTPEAEEAGRKASSDLNKVYGEGAAGRLPLAEWVAIHLKLVPSYRYFPDFAAHDEELADRALELGGTALAAVEYRRSLIMMKNLQELPDQDIPPERFDRLQFKLARALARGGRWQEARAALAEIDATRNEEIRDKVNGLTAKILSELGDADGLLRTFVTDPDAENMREMGRALFQKEQWPEAAAFYQSLWDRYPGRFNAEDASYLLIAAYRSDDAAMMRAVVDAFPGLTESQGLREMAASLLESPPPLLPLRQDNAARRLENLDRSLRSIKDSGL
jgi:tetratricopeptide (TPR) repeat protein